MQLRVVDPAGTILATGEPIAVDGREHVRGEAERALNALLDQRDTRERVALRIEFAVLQSWHDEIFEDWTAQYDDGVPLGLANPVTLRSVDRLGDLPGYLDDLFRRYLNQPAPALGWLTCHEFHASDRFVRRVQAELRRDPRPGAVGLAGVPADDALRSVHKAGVRRHVDADAVREPMRCHRDRLSGARVQDGRRSRAAGRRAGPATGDRAQRSRRGRGERP